MLLLVGSAHGWISQSQSIYGAQISEIQDQMNGLKSNRDVVTQLGFLWTMPEAVDDSTGLGGGITWAWNPELCELLKPRFREGILGQDFLDCDDYRAAIAHAFDTWAANNRHIKFLDVTRECELAGLNFGPPKSAKQLGQPHGGCPFAEIWVTLLAIGSSGRQLTESDETLDVAAEKLGDNARNHVNAQSGSGKNPVATAKPFIRRSSTFRYTNGARPFHNEVVETYAGELTFNTEDVCWYLDSAFCSQFHALKESLGGAQSARILVDFLTYGLMTLGLVFYLVFFCRIAYRSLGARKRKVDEDGDDEFSWRERSTAGVRAVSHWNPCVLSTFLTLLIVPPLLNTLIFSPCFDCFDFEAAALHEIGHFLGLGHPDNIPDNWAFPDVPIAGPLPGNNSFHAGIGAAVLAGRRPTRGEFNCTNPWAGVRPGVPPGAEVEKIVDVYDFADGRLAYSYPVRNAQMEARTQHNPLSCLTDDDLEGLAVLYPDCGDYALSGAVCHKQSMHIGLVRVGVYVLFPALVSLLLVVCFSSIVHQFERRERKRMQKSG